MDFLLSVFSLFTPETSLQNSKQNHYNTLQQVYQSHQINSLSPQYKSSQSCLYSNQFEKCSTELVDFNNSAFFQLIQAESDTSPFFGDFVGIVGQQICFSKILNENTRIRIGKSQQINSIGAIRKNALDALLVYYDESSCQYDFEQIFLAQQKLVFVVKSEFDLTKILSKLRGIISQLFTNLPLAQSFSYLCIEITKYENQIFLQFKERNYFLEHFENELRKINLHVQSKQEYQILIQKIDLKDYLDFRQGLQSTSAKLLKIQKQIRFQLEKAKRKQQELKFIKLIELASEDEHEKVQIKPIRKNSSFQADIEAEYFKIRASQKKTRETEFIQQIDTAELFYLIQERDNSCNSDKSEEKPAKVVPRRKLNKDATRQRSKSENCIETMPKEFLDDQFFNKQ